MSKNFISLLPITVLLSATVAAHRFVTPAGAQTVADANSLGVAREGNVAGTRIAVDSIGTASVEAGAAVAVGATVKSDATGRAITWVTSGARLGVALEAATAAGQFIECRLLDNAA